MERRAFLSRSFAAVGALAGASACSAEVSEAGQSDHPATDNNMNLTIRRSADRGRADHGWLDARHTFSFASYHDPRFMGFRSLRVINQDRVLPGRGFSTHPHRDMEIFSYVLEGAIEHKDSMGNGRTLRPGEIQLMSAGTGVTHSEFNPNSDENLRLLQIWIEPRVNGLVPSYTEWKPDAEAAASKDVVVISPDGRDGSAVIQQDAIVRRLRLEPGDVIDHEISEGRGTWIQMVSGRLGINAVEVHAGDGASTEDVGTLRLAAQEPVEALLFDLG